MDWKALGKALFVIFAIFCGSAVFIGWMELCFYFLGNSYQGFAATMSPIVIAGLVFLYTEFRDAQ